METHQFAQRLKETKAWCALSSRHVTPYNFRSPELKPDKLDVSRDMIDWIVHRGPAGISELAGKRAQLLSGRNLDLLSGESGRVLVFNPYDSLSDGASEVETRGFIDNDNAPAWDTWIGYTQYLLLSWVPSALIQGVESAIEINPEQCLMWAKDVDNSFLHHPDVYPLL